MSDSNPQVSVVMAVRNGGPLLRETLASVLNQQDVSLEFIVVDDGSTDDTPRVLAECSAADERLCIVAQENAGLTQALIRGCAMARGEYVARQDAGDRSLRGRLSQQVQYLNEHQDVTLLSAGARFVAPAGEELYASAPAESAEEATRRLRSTDLNEQRCPPHHGATMFRRRDYLRAGGYRWQFYYAQDLDLWSRLTDFGRLAVLPEVLYEARWDEGTISSSRRREQQALRRLALRMQQSREVGESEEALLAEAACIRPRPGRSVPRGQGYYFIARMLACRGDARAVHYLKLAVRSNRFHARAWLFLLRHALVRR